MLVYQGIFRSGKKEGPTSVSRFPYGAQLGNPSLYILLSPSRDGADFDRSRKWRGAMLHGFVDHRAADADHRANFGNAKQAATRRGRLAELTDGVQRLHTALVSILRHHCASLSSADDKNDLCARAVLLQSDSTEKARECGKNLALISVQTTRLTGTSFSSAHQSVYGAINSESPARRNRNTIAKSRKLAL